MARIHITIDIPKDGPAQVSITTEGNSSSPAAKVPALKPTREDTAQTATSDLGDLRATREARGWSQRELARRIGCSMGTITLIERGKRPISNRLRAKIQSAGIVLMDPKGNGVHRSR
jgi:ribosome-binding protein aMBF1 (putative translation factor)